MLRAKEFCCLIGQHRKFDSLCVPAPFGGPSSCNLPGSEQLPPPSRQQKLPLCSCFAFEEILWTVLITVEAWGVLQSPFAKASWKRGIFPSEWPQHLPLQSSEARDAIPHILQDSGAAASSHREQANGQVTSGFRRAQGLGNKIQGHSALSPVLQPSIPLSSVWEGMHPSPAPGTTH